MLYLVAHSFFNGQSKNSNLFPLPELHETQFKKKPWSSGDENGTWTKQLSMAANVRMRKVLQTAGFVPFSSLELHGFF